MSQNVMATLQDKLMVVVGETLSPISLEVTSQFEMATLKEKFMFVVGKSLSPFTG